VAILLVVNVQLPRLNLIQAIDHLSNIDNFVSSIADVFALLCLVELALSCLRALSKEGVYHSIIRYSNFIAIAVLFVLAVAGLGTGEDWVITSNDGRNYRVSWTTVGNLYGAYSIIYWIPSLVVVFLSSCVLYISMRKKHLQSVSKASYTVAPPLYILLVFYFINPRPSPLTIPSKPAYWFVLYIQIACFYLAASLFNLTRSTYNFSYAVLYYINYNPYKVVPTYMIVVDPILYTWFTIVMFGLLIAIGSKKLNGLWSQQQQLPQQGYRVENSGGKAFYGGQGPGVAPSPTYILYQQPNQAELMGSAAPTFRAELGNVGYPNPNQQYYVVQNQQQSPLAQNQMQNAGFVPVPMNAPTQQYRVAPMYVAPSIPGGDNFVRASTHEQQPQVTQPNQVAGTLDQKAWCDEVKLASQNSCPS
jgi:hypothetical protein